MTSPDALRTLRSIDWDFAVPRSGYISPPHWYPGTFIPSLSDALIEALTKPHCTIFDPYCGIGTSGWSAIRTGRSCYLADINPVALLVAYSTSSLLTLSFRDKHHSEVALGVLARIAGAGHDLFGTVADEASLHNVDEIISLGISPTPDVMLDEVTFGMPNWLALEHWIAEPTLTDLKSLVSRLVSVSSAFVRLLGLCMISAITRSLSSQHASWGHIADNVRPREMKAKEVTESCLRWIKRLRRFINPTLAYVRDGTTAYPSSAIYRRDWSRTAQPSASDADLLITSPPYADAIDYTLAQRLSLYLLGYDEPGILSLVSGEIGARRKRFKTDSRAVWSDQLLIALQDQLQWIKPDAPVCLILPHRDSGRSIGENAVKDGLDALGWRLFFERDRSIHQSHTRQSWTSIKRETILVFLRA